MQRKDHKQKNSSIDGSRLRVGVVVSEYNADITEPMLVGAMETLHACKVRPDRIHIAGPLFEDYFIYAGGSAV